MVRLEIRSDYVEVNGHRIYVDEELRKPILSESSSTLSQFVEMQEIPGLLAAVGLPDIHSGYGFPIGSVAAVDLGDPRAAVSPKGIGFDINCGVRCMATNLFIGDCEGRLEELADALAGAVPTDVGGGIPGGSEVLNDILDRGLDALSFLRETDRLHTESRGCLPGCSRLVGQKAKACGLSQIGTLGSGNHYLEVQVVDEIIDRESAGVIGIEQGQIVVSIHTGSRGLGHTVCGDFLAEVEKRRSDSMKYSKYWAEREGGSQVESGPPTAESAIPVASPLGQKYIALMNSAANYAWANRAVIAGRVGDVFSALFPGAVLSVIYDASHNIAREESVNNKTLLVHRKGASRILPPGHGELPPVYSAIGQPVLVGGSMGTFSYILVGAQGAASTFFSTCHGAGRLLSRREARTAFSYEGVSEELGTKGIIFRTVSNNGLVEEAPGCYKDVTRVVSHSNKVGISKSVARLRPIVVIKG